MINSHSRVGAPPECGFLHWWHAKYRDWNYDDGRNPVKVGEFVSDLLTSKKIESWNLEKSRLSQYILALQPGDYGTLTAACYQYWAEQGGKKVDWIADKNNYYIRHLDVISDAWPQAKYILIVRDGRDVACSYLEVSRLHTDSPYKPVFPTEIDDIAREWLSNNQRVLDFFEGLGEKDSMTLRYEDLVREPEICLRAVCQFLGVEFEGQMLRYYLDGDVHQREPEVTLDWKKKTMEKPDSSNIGKYKSCLTPSQVSLFDVIAERLLKRFGYCK